MDLRLRAFELTDGVDAVRAGFTPELLAENNNVLVGCGTLRWWDESDGMWLYQVLGWTEPVPAG